MIKDISFREIYSPITKNQLEPLDQRCERLQFNSQLSEKDYRLLAEFLRDNPNVGLRVYGNYDRSISDLSFLKHFNFIRKFSIALWDLNTFDQLEYLSPNLVELGLGQTYSKRVSLRILEKFPYLRKLFLEGHIKDFYTVGQLKNLEDLTLRSISLPDLSTLTTLDQLKSLNIKLGGITDLRLLPNIGELRYLELWLIRGLADITPVAEVESLQYLFLQDLKRVTGLPSLEKLTALRRLHIDTLKGLYDLEPIITAPALEQLVIIGSHLQPKAFRSLVDHPTLKSATIYLGSDKNNKMIQEMLGLPKVPGYWDEFEFV